MQLHERRIAGQPAGDHQQAEQQHDEARHRIRAARHPIAHSITPETTTIVCSCFRFPATDSSKLRLNGA